jgi:uncharacterized protein (DUF934 family)
MPLWRHGAFAEDTWKTLVDDSALAAGPVIVSLARFRRDALAANGSVGVALTAGPEALEALPDLVNLPLIALNFAAFGDGRAFSYAILLRQRLGFRGELRAVGDVLIDEIPLMLRCGFDAFDVSNEATLRALREQGAPRFPLAYQPGLSGETRDPSRPWARRLA